MHRSNPIGFTCSVLFLAALGLGYLWSHRFPHRAQLWCTEAWLGAAALGGLFLWFHGMRLRMLIQGVPTSQIASAPQGYVELAGRATSAGSRLPGAAEFVLWKRTEIATRGLSRRSRDFPLGLVYVTTSTEVTDTPWCIEDASGQALVVPAGAEVICSRRDVQYSGDLKITTETIQAGDPLYVLGRFSTLRDETDVPAMTERLINDWKMDKDRRARFDTNRDGILNGSELLAMHGEARRVASAKAAETVAVDGSHIISAPADGRRFVIANYSPEKLARHYHWYLALGLALAIGGLAGSVALYRNMLVT